MDILIYLLIILAIGLIVWSLAFAQRGSNLGRLPPITRVSKRANPGILLSRILPTRLFLEQLRIYPKLKKKIEASHINITPEGYFNLKILIMIGLVMFTPIALGKFDPIYIIIAIQIFYNFKVFLKFCI